MKKILTLLTTLLALAACQDDLSLPAPGGSTEGMREIVLQQPVPQEIETRAEGSSPYNDPSEYRVENVILFAFGSDGTLLNKPVQQSVTEAGTNSEQHQLYKVRTYLPAGATQLYAVCNHDADLTTDVKSLADLQAQTLAISAMEEAFKGIYVMEGMTTELTPANGQNIAIPLTRLAAKQSFTIVFNPDEKGDQFKVSRILVRNIPKVSNLLDLPMGENKFENYIQDPATGADQLTNWTADAVWAESAEARAANYLPETEVEFEKGTTDVHESYTFSFNLFENRRGGVTADAMDAALGISDRTDEEKATVRELYKRQVADPADEIAAPVEGIGELHRDEFDYATYVVIEGAYQTGSNNYEAKYYVYLGSNNYGDFNVVRNHHYEYTVTIRACDDMDTRVWAHNVNAPTFLTSTAPFDAFYNARQVVLSSGGPWEVYVENPDETPWLEISTSPTYRARPLGKATADDDYASFRISDNGGVYNLYIHTDEYVPDITDPSQNDDFPPRVGTICYHRTDGVGDLQRYTVIQYPAQMVVIEAWDIALVQKVEHKFFISRFPQEKYLPWGFENFWNMTLDNLISTGLYNGLSNTRKEYASALYGDRNSDSRRTREEAGDILPLTDTDDDLAGHQNACYWEDTDPEKDGWQNTNLREDVPTDIALGYALNRNRDRNNSGHIDYNEILWYLPSTMQMEGVYEALHPESGTSNLYGEYVYEEVDENGKPTSDKGQYLSLSVSGNFWTSTPSVSDAGGITPGRAYYVDMNEGERLIGLRDQAFKVLVCRDAEGWLGPNNAGGSITPDNDNGSESWESDGPINTPRHNGN